jgi:hypothetical protein
MSDDFIKKALEGAALSFIDLIVQEEELKRKSEEIERQQYKLLLKMLSLTALADDIPESALVAQLLKRFSKAGLTKAVRAVLMISGEWMTPTQVRDHLIRLNFNIDKYQNALASIHTVLGRFAEDAYSSIEVRPSDKGRAEYRWATPKSNTMTDLIEAIPPDQAKEALSLVASKFVSEPSKRFRKSRKSRKNKK